MTEWLITLRYKNGYTINIYEQFTYENPTKDEIDKLLNQNKRNTSWTEVVYEIPTIIFMQKLYRR
jgi:hypothetical protein